MTKATKTGHRPQGEAPAGGGPPAGGRGAAVSVSGVGIGFGSFVAVQDITLDIPAGEFLCLLGPSGCGKSTLLSALAGFVPVRQGGLTVDGAPVTGPDPGKGMVFQSTEALFDWMTVRQNVAFGPRMAGRSRAEQNATADEYLRLVGLRHCADRFPGQLSGGMRQRVQIARVLANQPRVVLMDEPFGALDAQTRQVMQEEMARIWQASGCTVVFVTHDIDEALVLADRVAVMTAGPAAGIKAVYSVDLPRPRDDTAPETIALRAALRRDIGEEVRKSLREQGVEDAGDETEEAR
ncbi:ABC transporter ATP-binding protein [Actinomadura sp. 9N407]|uniref:ABC transporter ATP-binding protein n=1 Tax=Actinomadura sp. 9N407 TaxID=3375154 RepID=UPI0037A3D998